MLLGLFFLEVNCVKLKHTPIPMGAFKLNMPKIVFLNHTSDVFFTIDCFGEFNKCKSILQTCVLNQLEDISKWDIGLLACPVPKFISIIINTVAPRIY
ncbi:unnamed protein product [Moneuplotes crassus]|uniref:Uncharacterized protein n=1 Tax=Euplotes crassus TaxID=5936 RepID=A0AAD1XPU1_EUPCR|nr:unnamed protein product [Moneuplotes crassus]